jgi:hypothetical protein
VVRQTKPGFVPFIRARLLGTVDGDEVVGQVFGSSLGDEHEGELRLPRNRRVPPETEHVAIELPT